MHLFIYDLVFWIWNHMGEGEGEVAEGEVADHNHQVQGLRARLEKQLKLQLIA
jgi:hypothetical protein